MWGENLAPELRSETSPAGRTVFLAAGWTLWRELVLPSRRIWVGIACAWVLIAVLNLASSEPTTKVASQPKPRSGEELSALIEQRRMFAQLIGPLSEPAYIQKRASPGPRSDRAVPTSAA